MVKESLSEIISLLSKRPTKKQEMINHYNGIKEKIKSLKEKTDELLDENYFISKKLAFSLGIINSNEETVYSRPGKSMGSWWIGKNKDKVIAEINAAQEWCQSVQTLKAKIDSILKMMDNKDYPTITTEVYALKPEPKDNILDAVIKSFLEEAYWKLFYAAKENNNVWDGSEIAMIKSKLERAKERCEELLQLLN
ncbi:hypothetical protein HOE07_02555 [archaeon]|jgi:hypothetical protein|nr:hypothetical protein [archaeon]